MAKKMDTRDKPTKDNDPAPLSEHEKAMRGIVGTPKAEVDAEERKPHRRRTKRPKKR